MDSPDLFSNAAQSVAARLSPRKRYERQLKKILKFFQV